MEQVSTWLGAHGGGRDRRRPRTVPRMAATGRGAVTIMFSLMVLVMIGFVGMALDLGQIYNRKAELQNIASTAALAAARQLNGTTAGVTAALSKAHSTANALTYGYGQQAVSWSNAAISFSTTASGDWVDAASAQSAPAGLLFAKVDTSALDASVGAVSLAFMRILSSAFASVNTATTAIAGRNNILVTPLAICAMSATAAASRVNPPGTVELVEFGFRRGVSYDLMQLNPNGTTAVNYVIDPLDPPGTVGTDANTWPATVGPFACTGSLAMPRVTGGTITVASPFPLDALYQQLNSRFDKYVGNLCSPNGAPPDTNVMPYGYAPSIAWMNTVPGQQSALRSTSGGKLWTVADLPPGTTGTAAAAADYGPLWAYARAVPWSAYVASPTEPAAGYTPFNTGNWAVLYNPGQPTANYFNYPSAPWTPYKVPAGAGYFTAPSTAHQPGLANRRVLNVALLRCPISGAGVTTATVLGIGRFFMTVPATTTSIFAEFAGAVPEQAVGGQVELIQ